MVVDIDETRHALAGLRGVFRALLQPGAGEVADDLGAVLVAARLGRGIDLRQEFVLDRDGNSLHQVLSAATAPLITSPRLLGEVGIQA
ncbi:hypothetical protein ACVWY3_006188 [Bradyrhizobium sp. USDA 4486]